MLQQQVAVDDKNYKFSTKFCCKGHVQKLRSSTQSHQEFIFVLALCYFEKHWLYRFNLTIEKKMEEAIQVAINSLKTLNKHREKRAAFSCNTTQFSYIEKI